MLLSTPPVGLNVICGKGAASAFMVTGPATKITNLGALKIVLGARNFALYILFVVIFSLLTGAIVNLIPF